MQNKKIIPLMLFVGACLAAGITLIWLLTDPVEIEIGRASCRVRV